MSFPVDCPGCASGRHERHNAGWGTRAGLIGGLSCDCSGDCAERAEADSAEWAEEFSRLFKSLRPDVVHLMAADGSMPLCPLDGTGLDYTARPEGATCPDCTQPPTPQPTQGEPR